MNCTARYKAKSTQAQIAESFKDWSKQTIKQYGGLPPNAWTHFKKGFKRGFMRSCKMKNKMKTVKSKSKSKSKSKKQ